MIHLLCRRPFVAWWQVRFPWPQAARGVWPAPLQPWPTSRCASLYSTRHYLLSNLAHSHSQPLLRLLSAVEERQHGGEGVLLSPVGPASATPAGHRQSTLAIRLPPTSPHHRRVLIYIPSALVCILRHGNPVFLRVLLVEMPELFANNAEVSIAAVPSQPKNWGRLSSTSLQTSSVLMEAIRNRCPGLPHHRPCSSDCAGRRSD